MSSFMTSTTATTQKKAIHVAVGLIMCGQKVLISWRNASQHQGNRYEFPGGKIEPNETPEQGLIRELLEELGIAVQNPIRTQQLSYDYPEKTVCLHVFKITQFTGEPRGQEGQEVRWVDQHDLSLYQFPDANAPILRAATCPEQYLICHEQLTTQSLTDWLDFHVQHVPERAWLYVRHHQLTGDAYYHVINALSQARADLKLVAMKRHISQFENTENLAGIHYSKQDLIEALPEHLNMIDEKVILKFAACKNQQEIEKAVQLNMDAIILGAVNATLTHPDLTPLGWTAWQQLCLESPLPVYALGGITPEDLITVQQRGGFGVAGIRGFYPLKVK